MHVFPGIGIPPDRFSLGGLLLGTCINLFGGWLYLYDLNRVRGRWGVRRAFGVAVILCGWLTIGLGYWLAVRRW